MKNVIEKTQRLIEGVNIGKLPDPFVNLTNNKIVKIKGDDYISSLNEDYKKLLESVDKMTKKDELRIGDVVKGKILKIGDKEIIVDFNYKDYIFIDNKIKNSIIDKVNEGDIIDVLIVDIIDNPFIIKGSITDLLKINIQDKIKIIHDNNDYVKARVIDIKPAGFILDVIIDGFSVDGFLPNTLASANKLTDLQSENLVGKTIEVMFENLYQDKGIYVMNRKKYLNHHHIPQKLNDIREQYILDRKKMKDGEILLPTVYDGYVTGTSNFGVFVEFCEGLTGMIHKFNINPTHQDRLHEILPGTYIQFYIKEITKKDRIILTQVIRESLWDTIKVNHILKGEIIDVKNFGALVSLDDETNGLIQNAHIPEGRVIKTGDIVNVKVVSIIKDDRKIYLSLNLKNKKDN
jgi:small subunit ribosomal protein S1